MHRRITVAVVAGAVGAALLTVLLSVAAVTGALVPAVVAAAIGIVEAGLLCLVVLRVAGAVVSGSRRAATRAKNLETQLAVVRLEAEARRQEIEVLRTQVSELGGALRGTRKDVRVLRSRVPAGFLHGLEQQVNLLATDTKDVRRASFESAIQLGRNPRSVVSERAATELFEDYLARGDHLRLRPLIEHFDLLDGQSLTTLRTLYRFFRSSGYWDLAELAVRHVQARSGGANDARALAKISREIELFTRPAQVRVDLPRDGTEVYDPEGPVVHMVGRVLPDTQTGYTLRTQYTVAAQSAKGLPVAVVGQVGISSRTVDEIESYQVQGIDYYLLPGPARNTMLIDEWLELNMRELAELVRQLRPSILHAQSDFFNALIVDVVGRAYGVPTVYESRGFWEESWLSRTISANGWTDDAQNLFRMYGLPAAYELRKHAEESARLQPDHVFTLAEVMRDHILESAHGAIPSTGVSIVPNAVDGEAFPLQTSDPDLAAATGIPDGAVVVGYISSIVEYEGIDTLIHAYQQVAALTDTPICLLIVGDGDHLPILREQVQRLGVQDVIFTGRVPHEQVLGFYGLIDIFVVPRKPSTVADLVTPLKPFEAFATGRAVILSDVGALREIALQSAAVETFRAGDAEDLSRSLLALLNDPDHRRDLGRRAARWVRNHRSWEGNVNQYYRIYRQLGFRGQISAAADAELSLEDQGINPGELLEALREAVLPAARGWFTIQDVKQPPEDILRVGWRFASFDPVPVAEIEDWSPYGAEHRSWGFHLHAWEFMDPLLRAYDESGDQHWLQEAVLIAVRWTAAHRAADDADDPMAWYDMSQALRAPRLLALLLRAARQEELRSEALILAEAFAWHLQELHRDRAYNPNNNHGFYTAASQVHAAMYAPMFPEAEATRLEGGTRLAQMVDSQFAADGVHLEHSPDYHRMLLKSFEEAIVDGLIESEDVRERIRRAAHVLGWMIQPDGALVQFGDSPETVVVRDGAMSTDPATAFLLSDGREGSPGTREMAVFDEGGYAFVRSPQPTSPGEASRSSYLAMSAAFHSRAHKHADDLNVVWFDRGQQILTDAGRYGYGDLLDPDSPRRADGFYYAAAERQYVESTPAHNTLAMDGKDQERRRRQPYGSGIGDCREKAGVFDLSGRVHHLDYIHRRRIVFRPGEELLVKDAIFSQSTDLRSGVLWFNVAGHFELIETGSEHLQFASRIAGNSTLLEVVGPGTLVEPVTGRTEPLRGWRSRVDRTLEPTWSFGFQIDIDTRLSVDTRFTIGPLP